MPKITAHKPPVVLIMGAEPALSILSETLTGLAFPVLYANTPDAALTALGRHPVLAIGPLSAPEGLFPLDFWKTFKNRRAAECALMLYGPADSVQPDSVASLDAFWLDEPLRPTPLRLNVGRLLASQLRSVAQQNEIDRLHKHNERLRKIREMSLLLNADQSFDALFAHVVDFVSQLMECERASLYLWNERDDILWTKVAQGVDGCVYIPMNKGLAALAFAEDQPLLVDDAATHPDFDGSWDEKHGFVTRSVLCYPVHNRQHERKGVLQVINSRQGQFVEADLELAAVCAAHIGVILENFNLVNELIQAFESTIRTLTTVIDAKHPLTAGHSYRVTEYSLFLGRHLGLSEGDIEVLKYAALLHDVGKIGIPDEILKKNGPFNAEERAIMNEHALWTHRILKKIHLPKSLRDIPEMALCHHEKYNGSGYHQGLQGLKIPYFSRIITVADVFDALTSPRDYPKYSNDEVFGLEAMEMSRVFTILDKDKGSHFDPTIADIALHHRAELEELHRRLHAEGSPLPAEDDSEIAGATVKI